MAKGAREKTRQTRRRIDAFCILILAGSLSPGCRDERSATDRGPTTSEATAKESAGTPGAIPISVRFPAEKFRPREILLPRDASELARHVKRAHEGGLRFRVSGSRHSANDAVVTDSISINLRNFKKLEYNEQDETVTVGAGVTVDQATTYLFERKKSLLGIPNEGGCMA